MTTVYRVNDCGSSQLPGDPWRIVFTGAVILRLLDSLLFLNGTYPLLQAVADGSSIKEQRLCFQLSRVYEANIHQVTGASCRDFDMFREMTFRIAR